MIKFFIPLILNFCCKLLFLHYIGGSRGRYRRAPHPTPQQDPFLSFSHTFLLKSVCVGGRRPPLPTTGRRPNPTGNPGSATALSTSSSKEILINSGADPGGCPGGPGPPLTTKNEAPAPKFYKTEAPEWQF